MTTAPAPNDPTALLETGGMWEQAAHDLDTIARAAAALGFHHCELDLARRDSKAAFLAAMAEAFRFPDWFGDNWDALEDCLTDLGWLPAPGYVLVLRHADAFAHTDPDAYRIATAILDEAVHYWAVRHIPMTVLLDRPQPTDSFDNGTPVPTNRKPGGTNFV